MMKFYVFVMYSDWEYICFVFYFLSSGFGDCFGGNDREILNLCLYWCYKCVSLWFVLELLFMCIYVYVSDGCKGLVWGWVFNLKCFGLEFLYKCYWKYEYFRFFLN